MYLYIYVYNALMLIKKGVNNMNITMTEHRKMNELQKQTKEVNRLEDLYQTTYEKYDKKMDKLIEKRDLALECIWDSFVEEKAKLQKMLGDK
mgnify:CR=1 FL=1